LPRRPRARAGASSRHESNPDDKTVGGRRSPSCLRIPTVAALLGETVSLICFVAMYGPPVVFLAAPWLLLGLILSGPFALVVTLVVTLLAATALVGGIGAILATPYLIIRRQRAAHASIARPAAARVPVELRRVAA
jgi:hypothetical protein